MFSRYPEQKIPTIPVHLTRVGVKGVKKLIENKRRDGKSDL